MLGFQKTTTLTGLPPATPAAEEGVHCAFTARCASRRAWPGDQTKTVAAGMTTSERSCQGMGATGQLWQESHSRTTQQEDDKYIQQDERRAN